MGNTDKRLSNIETQLREISSALPKLLENKGENISMWRVAALRKLSRTNKQLGQLIEYIETELITHREAMINCENVVHLVNQFEEQGNDDLSEIVNILKKIKDGLHDKTD